ncbi:sel1 repeat family protein [Legionella dresdenensis]|uniref:Sel1 repeat family protein n=1 Tax=Legionella dresdenensis TaxID=450200 RepID=A0ABV8CCT1_9GAMM
MTGCVKQHNFVEGINCFRAQQYRSAFVLLKPEAVKGQPDAQYAIGYMYYYGQGVVENRKKAWFWICKAAKAGQPEAIQALKILKRTPEYPGQLMNRAHNE